MHSRELYLMVAFIFVVDYVLALIIVMAWHTNDVRMLLFRNWFSAGTVRRVYLR